MGSGVFIDYDQEFVFNVDEDGNMYFIYTPDETSADVEVYKY